MCSGIPNPTCFLYRLHTWQGDHAHRIHRQDHTFGHIRRHGNRLGNPHRRRQIAGHSQFQPYNFHTVCRSRCLVFLYYIQHRRLCPGYNGCRGKCCLCSPADSLYPFFRSDKLHWDREDLEQRHRTRCNYPPSDRTSCPYTWHSLGTHFRTCPRTSRSYTNQCNIRFFHTVRSHSCCYMVLDRLTHKTRLPGIPVSMCHR